MFEGIAQLGNNCLKLFTGSTGIQGRALLGNKVNDVTFYDGTEDRMMNFLGGGLNVSFAMYHSMYPSVAASVLLGKGNKITPNVVLWADFYGAVDRGNPTPRSDQAWTLAHEIVHIYTGLSDDAAVSKWKIDVHVGENASQAFDRWLHNNCKN